MSQANSSPYGGYGGAGAATGAGYAYEGHAYEGYAYDGYAGGYENHERHESYGSYGSSTGYEGYEGYSGGGYSGGGYAEDGHSGYGYAGYGAETVPAPAPAPDPAPEPADLDPGPDPDFDPDFDPDPDPVPAEPRPGGRAEARRAARRRKTAKGPDSLRRIVPQALVVAFLAGGTSAFIAEDKAVELSVDGTPRTLHTFADDVTELIADEGLDVGDHDIVAPAPDTTLASGDRVVVRYGRPVRLTLDGERREVWTTARTVDGALRQLGVRAEGAHLSAERDQRISRSGLRLDVRTERTITVMADGRERTIRTNAATVREAVEAAGISLRGQDTTSVPPDSFPRDGQTVTVMRITGTKEVREEPIEYDVQKTDDPSLYRGTEVVVRPGRNGAKRVTYALRTVNGVKQKPKRIRADVVRKPETQLVKVGTKPLPTSVHGADDLNWSALASCESGGRPDALDPSGTYGGLYQFDTRTWQGLGGTGSAQDAPAAEQTYRAKKLYVQRGASPWPHCGGRLH